MLERDPNAWQASKELLVTPELAYLFLKEYQNGIIAMDRTQPWLPDILNGAQAYQFQRRQQSRGHFRASYAQKMKSALSRLQVAQCSLRMVPLDSQKISSDSAIRHFISNLIVDTLFEAKA